MEGHRIPYAFLLYVAGKIDKKKHAQPDLRQLFISAILKSLCDTLPLWMLRFLFHLSGVCEQVINGLFFGKLRKQWCRSVSGPGWKGYLIGEDAETAEIGDGADLVVIYAHGGGFVCGGALVSLVVFVDWIKTWKSSHGAKTHIVSLEYALSPEHSFPVARDTLLQCYHTLVVEKGLDPSKIAFAGDSAGGNLAVVASLELTNNPSKYSVPQPSRLLLISPVLTALKTSKSFKFNEDYDCLSTQWFDLCLENYIYNTNLLPTCPMISPLLERRLEGLPRTWVCVGGYELFLDDIKLFVEKARSQDVQAEIVVEENNVHNYAIVYPLSRDDGAQKAAKYMSRFIFGDQPVKRISD
ncbi:17219_t:CDS:2 [Acaulospora colombiana]|uniref:17219_t:CDS:1 n=1 Tax=Acaulospora colombiana TaxID=27376 RepID=A0ACA9K3M9_9GLOM|nr:17219_t:CDS:2 [Acaulospora colombiana]